MKANKRVRDLGRRSARRLYSVHDGFANWTTTYPLTRKDRAGSQVRNAVRLMWREVAR